ncbi:MAG: hypothetical protein SFV54_08020 [Bryobacteraceae bacterium]|nr:hypothetical protein [Bryobacteraceae bacterium]
MDAFGPGNGLSGFEGSGDPVVGVGLGGGVPGVLGGAIAEDGGGADGAREFGEGGDAFGLVALPGEGVSFEGFRDGRGGGGLDISGAAVRGVGRDEEAAGALGKGLREASVGEVEAADGRVGDVDFGEDAGDGVYPVIEGAAGWQAVAAGGGGEAGDGVGAGGEVVDGDGGVEDFGVGFADEVCGDGGEEGGGVGGEGGEGRLIDCWGAVSAGCTEPVSKALGTDGLVRDQNGAEPELVVSKAEEEGWVGEGRETVSVVMGS